MLENEKKKTGLCFRETERGVGDRRGVIPAYLGNLKMLQVKPAFGTRGLENSMKAKGLQQCIFSGGLLTNAIRIQQAKGKKGREMGGDRMKRGKKRKWGEQEEVGQREKIRQKGPMLLFSKNTHT